MTRFLLVLISICLVFLAVIRVSRRFGAAVKKPDVPQKSNESNSNAPLWINSNTLSVRRGQIETLGPPPQKGDLYVLGQRALEQNRCSIGTFKIDRISEHRFVLKRVNGKNDSRLLIWANSQNIPVVWHWQKLGRNQAIEESSQLCSDWFMSPSAARMAELSTQSNPHFISARRYTEVAPESTSQVAVSADSQRMGWWIKPTLHHHTVVLRVRSAATGQLENLKIQFRDRTRHGRNDKRVKGERELNRFFTLPGWD